MPFKANAERRHRIPKQRQKVTNWAEYDAGLRARGSLTVWFTAEAIQGWRAEARTGRGGQAAYSTHRGQPFHAIVGASSTPSRAG